MTASAAHLPLITDEHASCTCKRWNGLKRAANVTVGQFTISAYEAHAEHVRNTKPQQKHDGQATMFGQVDLFERTN